jgi:DNA-binding CsgD family transcriptional regulator
MFCIKNLSSALDLTEKEYITMMRLCQLLTNFEIL